MTFRISLIGSAQRPIVEFDVGNLIDLAMLMNRGRFLVGRLIATDGDDDDCTILLPVSRIQFVTEFNQ